MNVAIFDFCDTLVNFQTADEFVKYTFSRYPNRLKRNVVFFPIKRKLIGNKSALLSLLRGLTEGEIDEAAMSFYDNIVQSNIFTSMEDIIHTYQESGYKIIIISGGYSVYINLYAKKHGIDKVIANDFAYKEKAGQKIFRGKCTAKDCMNQEKVFRLEDYLKGTSIEKSVAYSDSLSDLPILKWADKGVLVSKYKCRKSASENNLEQIVLVEFEKDRMPEEYSYKGVL